MTPRIKQLDAVFTSALHDVSLSFTGVAQAIHRGVPEVKHVALVRNKDQSQFTYSVLFHDRERLSVTLVRMAEEELLGADEREVERPVDLPEPYTLDVELKDGEITLH